MIFPKTRVSDIMRKRDDGPLNVTADGLRRLKEKLVRLKHELPHLIAEAERTAAYGDRSDNAEYKDSKGNLRRSHRQILGIESQIKRAVIINESANTSGIVEIGSVVEIESNGAIKKYKILGSFETKPEQGRISFKSPLGAALIDHRKGDVISIDTPSGIRNYTINSIE